LTDAHVLEEPAGTISVTPAVLEHIVQQAAESADGARVRRPRRALEVTIADGRAQVELELAVRLGVPLPELARDVQARVGDALGRMCGLEVEAVHVAIEELDP
jgi:uncharacterized alkaline shock family protein YloU